MMILSFFYSLNKSQYIMYKSIFVSDATAFSPLSSSIFMRTLEIPVSLCP